MTEHQALNEPDHELVLEVIGLIKELDDTPPYQMTRLSYQH